MAPLRIVPKLIVIEREAFTLTLYRMKGSRYVRERVYPVGIGTGEYQTPHGAFFIEAKARNPAWKMPNSAWVPLEKRGKIIPGGDPDNPLKAAFLALAGGQGVGIHGTAARNSIGTKASHGCIRMLVEDVKDLYGRVRVGTPVWVD